MLTRDKKKMECSQQVTLKPVKEKKPWKTIQNGHQVRLAHPTFHTHCD